MNNFVEAQRMVQALAASDIVPATYKGNVANCLVALEMSQRTGAGIMAVMQNLHVIHGRPSWSSSFIIAALNSCGRFAPLRFAVTGEGDKKECFAWTVDSTGERLDGPPVSIAMAKAEGWFSKSGSKWQTMPDLMLRYRAAAFFGRLYAPDVLMGMHSEDEAADIEPRDITPQKPANQNSTAASLNDELGSGAFGGGQAAAPAPQAAPAATKPRASRAKAAAAAPAGDVIEGTASVVDDQQPPAAETPIQEQAPQTQQPGSAGAQLW